MSESAAGEHAVALLRTDSHDPFEVELALGAVVDGGPAAISAFCLSFGPRHLMRALGNNRLSDRAAELADELLIACDGVGLTRDVDFGDVHHDQLYPDELINLSVREVPAVPDVAERLPLHLMGGQAAFASEYCDIVHSGDHADAHLPTLAADPPVDPVLRLRNTSRRERLGSEIECKVWPSAIILGRWLCRHTRLLKGQRVLECVGPSNQRAVPCATLPPCRAADLALSRPPARGAAAGLALALTLTLTLTLPAALPQARLWRRCVRPRSGAGRRTPRRAHRHQRARAGARPAQRRVQRGGGRRRHGRGPPGLGRGTQ